MGLLTGGITNFVRNRLLTRSVSSEQKAHWKENGYVIFRNAVSDEDIDALNSDVSKFRGSCGETKDEFGYGGRIGLFHIQNQHSLHIALNPMAQEFLRWAFQDEPLLFGSLTFEVGTQQSAHTDAIFFYTEPVYAMAGVWTALEDVPVDAGPLFYVPGSHNWKLTRGEEVLARNPDIGETVAKRRAEGRSIYEMGDLVEEASKRWHKILADKIETERKSRHPVVIRKGDVLIWHSLLVHGGLERKIRQLSRRSMVVHYVGKNAPMWDLNSYFLLKNKEIHPKGSVPFKVLNHRLGNYVQHERPVTY